VETLQRTVEEQGLAFGGARAKQEEKIKADRRLREEQDAAYLASLQIDKVCTYVYTYLSYDISIYIYIHHV
jgi:hypothetical protein